MGQYTRTQFTKAAISDCYGAEKLDEVWAWENFEAVLICVLSEGLVSQVPGESRNAVMVSQDAIEANQAGSVAEDGFWYLDPNSIKYAYQLEEEGSGKRKLWKQQTKARLDA